MNESWGILNDSLLWPALSAALLLLALFAYKEWRDGQGKRLYLRLLLAVCAIGALLGLVLKPALRQELAHGKALILTPGYDSRVADSLKKAHPGIRMVEYQPGHLLEPDSSFNSAIVLGHGFASYDLWQAEGRQVTFLPAESPSGINRLKRIPDGVLGRRVSIKGVYNNPVAGHRLLLRDPGGNPRDSAVVPAGSQWKFRLESVPKAAGNLTYLLEEQDSSGRVVRTDPVPLRIRRPSPMRVLILNTFPTFESRYLKNFLAEKGNEVVVRSQLTRGAYKFEYLNGKAQPVYQLSGENLQEFDLLIADAASYLNLGASSRTALRKSIEETGLGLLIQADARYLGLPEDRAYFGFRPDGRTTWDAGYDKGLVLDKYPYAFSMDFPIQPIVLPNGKQVGAYRPLGAGKVVTTLLKDTYQWVLQGKAEAYRELWTALLSQAAAEHNAPIAWEAQTPLPGQDEPFGFRIRGVLPDYAVENEQGFQLPLIQDLWNPTLWKGTDYPQGPGWTHLRITSDSLPDYHYYVFGENDWEVLRIQSTLNANRRFFEGTPESVITSKGMVPVSPLWFYTLFLASMGWLWLEPRLRG
jgi:hypothetical protein